MNIKTDDPRLTAAQLVVLTLVADGELANREIDAIDRHHISDLLGVPRDTLVQAVADHCQGLLASQATQGAVRVLDLEQTERLLDRIVDPLLQKLTCRAMLVLAKADGHISLAEQTLLRHALTRWGMTLESVAAD
ncbi:MAG: TerB family tellurite resistance protein [Thauera sp.]|nr:TerB family tellurite resistance protein [Thauera sp.]